ncbi:MAG: hypothetical protein HQL31_05985 [Planctomycetes bacterium]|nr:hypothetical protein [Planctomycetota bacterium]
MDCRCKAVPLTDYQAEISKLISVNRTPDSFLAGGAALHIKPNSKRYSNDLDYFNDSEERVAQAFAEDSLLLQESGYRVEVLMRQPGFVRALIHRQEASTKVEWCHDSAWRFLPVVHSELAGYQLHPLDLGINKLLALVGRDEPRDYVDIHEIMLKTLPLGALCWSAAGKDPGFTPPMLLEMLRRRGKFHPEDMARLHLREPVDLTLLKKVWLAALDDAECFIASRNPAEIGCLYYDPVRKAFIQPKPGQKAIPHFGKPGGVLPIPK